MMLFGVHSMIARHGTAGHTHRRRRRRLIGMRQLHRTAVQNERKREDDRKQGLLQAKTHDGSRAKSPANVHRIVFGEENCCELHAKPCSVHKMMLFGYESRPPMETQSVWAAPARVGHALVALTRDRGRVYRASPPIRVTIVSVIRSIRRKSMDLIGQTSLIGGRAVRLAEAVLVGTARGMKRPLNEVFAPRQAHLPLFRAVERPVQHRSHIGGMVSGLDIRRWPSGSGILMSE
jgi:hypothetical protein